MATKRPRKARFAKSSARVLRSSTASTSGEWELDLVTIHMWNIDAGVQKQKRKQLAVDVAALEELEQCSEDEGKQNFLIAQGWSGDSTLYPSV
jgi:hypothetical protein